MHSTWGLSASIATDVLDNGRRGAATAALSMASMASPASAPPPTQQQQQSAPPQAFAAQLPSQQQEHQEPQPPQHQQQQQCSLMRELQTQAPPRCAGFMVSDNSQWASDDLQSHVSCISVGSADVHVKAPPQDALACDGICREQWEAFGWEGRFSSSSQAQAQAPPQHRVHVNMNFQIEYMLEVIIGVRPIAKAAVTKAGCGEYEKHSFGDVWSGVVEHPLQVMRRLTTQNTTFSTDASQDLTWLLFGYNSTTNKWDDLCPYKCDQILSNRATTLLNALASIDTRSWCTEDMTCIGAFKEYLSNILRSELPKTSLAAHAFVQGVSFSKDDDGWPRTDYTNEEQCWSAANDAVRGIQKFVRQQGIEVVWQEDPFDFQQAPKSFDPIVS